MKNHRREQETYTLRTSIDGAGKTSCLAREVEVQIQPQQMVKYVSGHFSNGCLSHAGKHSISQLLEHRCPYSRRAICGVWRSKSARGHVLSGRTNVQAIIIAPATV